MLFDVNLLAVLGAAVLNMVLGALWYSPMLFGSSWMKEMKTNKKEMEEMKKR